MCSLPKWISDSSARRTPRALLGWEDSPDDLHFSSKRRCILDLMLMRPPYFRKFGLAVITCLLLVSAVSGQSPTMVTFDQAIDLALAHNHSLKATRTLILQHQAQEITANLRPNPTLNFDSQFLPIFQPSEFSTDNLGEVQQFDIGIGYLFERGKKRQHRLQAARDQTAVTRAQVADADARQIQRRTIVHRRSLLSRSSVCATRSEEFENCVDIGRHSISLATSAKVTISRSSYNCCSSRPTLLLGWSGGAARTARYWVTTQYRNGVVGDLTYQPVQAKLRTRRLRR